MSLNEKQSGLSKNVIPPLDLIIDSNNPQKVIEILNSAFADEAVLSLKTKNAKWNLCGSEFFELCHIYEIHYNQINELVEEIAIRIQMLHGYQICSFSEYLANTRLSETPGITPDAIHLLSDHESIIRFLREDYRNCTNFYEDGSTSEMLVRIIRQHEKIAWMLRSFIQRECITNVLETS